MLKTLFLFLLCAGLLITGRAQQKHFFQSVEVGFQSYLSGHDENAHSYWQHRLKGPQAYSLDTFSIYVPVAKNKWPEVQLFTLGVRLSKMLFGGKEAGFWHNRAEWRQGLYINTGATSSAWLVSNSHLNPNQTLPFAYKEVRYQYRRSLLNYHTQLVLRFPASGDHRKVSLYAGPGLGLIAAFNSSIAEELTTIEVTPTGGNGTRHTPVAVENNQTKGGTESTSYVSGTAGLQLPFSSSISALLEGSWQRELDAPQKSRLFKEAAVLAFHLRYSF